MNEKIRALLGGRGGNYIFPFFWQHGETEETLRAYMKVIAEANIGAVCVESRPHPDYCGPKWWQDMDVILDEARKRKMKVWILDDSHFPTGYANGAMEKQPDSLCRQSVCLRVYDLAGGKKLSIPADELKHPDPFVKSEVEQFMISPDVRKFDDDRLLGLFAVRVDGAHDGFACAEDFFDLTPDMEELAMFDDAALEWRAPEGEWKVHALHLSRNFGPHRDYINMMSRPSVRVLLDAVYEPHYAHYGKDFGETIEGFFSDEPELGNGHLYDQNDGFGTPGVDYPWSAELEERLLERLGPDYACRLPLLWETNADPALTAKVRYAYMDAVSDLVRKDFSEQLGGWCRDHGVRYIGHLIEDDNHHSRTGSSLGHYFRGLAGQDMAGVDDIGGQVLPQGEDLNYDHGIFAHRNGEFYHYMLARLASSAAAIEPLKKQNAMCEIFGAYGWSEGVRLEKYLLDHFMVRGVNHFVPHAFSPKEFPDPDCPPHFYAHGNNPQYRHFGALMAYANRVCELISGGRHIAPAAILYHGEGEWTGGHMKDNVPAHVLADVQIEYDIIPQDVFADPEAFGLAIRDGKLIVNTQEYAVLIVPYMQYVTAAFARAAARLAAAGVPVWYVDGTPEGICDTWTDTAQDAALVDGLKKSGEVVTCAELAGRIREMGWQELDIEPADNRIRYYQYVYPNGDAMYLLVNEGTKAWKGSVRFSGQKDGGRAYRYDAWENRIEEADVEADGQTDGVRIRMTLDPLHSAAFLFDGEALTEEERRMAAENRGLRTLQESAAACREETADAGWTRSVCRSIDYPAFARAKEVSLPDRLAEEEPEFSGFVRYERHFTAQEGERVLLEIGDAHEGVEVFVNGSSLGIQVAPPFRYDLTGAVRPGDNALTIEVATTLEREMAKIPDRFGQMKAAASQSGVTGTVVLRYFA